MFSSALNIDRIDVVFDTIPIGFNQDKILELARINTGDPIFILNETKIIEQIESGFSDNSVKVKNIERIFPNKIEISIFERLPVCAVRIENSTNFALADVDFQLNRIVTDEEAKDYIVLLGENMRIQNDFNIKHITMVRQIFLAFIKINVPYYALHKFIESIYCDSLESKYTVKLRDGRSLSFVLNNKDDVPTIDSGLLVEVK